MDVEILSRIQFALTIAFHYIYPPISIGLGIGLIIMEGLYLKTKNQIWQELTQFWVKIFALVFALGVSTGIVMVFGFGTNWANYSRFVGDVFGSALGAEGVFAFFMESGFLALLLFGWNRISPKMHFFSTIMVALGAHFSAVWIVVANSWMQTPAGYKIVGEGAKTHAVVTDFWEMVLNPSSVDRLTHVIIGCWLAGAFLILSVSSYYLYKKRFLLHAKCSMKVGIWMGLIGVILQLFSGDSTAKGVYVNQPVKLAACEGIYKTGPAPLALFGWVNTKEKKVEYAITIPGGLSFLLYGDFKHPVKGLDQFPVEDHPPVQIVFQAYHLMIAMWGMMATAVFLAIWAWRRRFVINKWIWRFLIISVIFPQIANQAGWFTAEVGRQPWIVWGVLRTSAGLSRTVGAKAVLGSIIMFSVIYTLLFALFIFLLNHKIKQGPHLLDDTESTYKNKGS
ncbi:MAG: cytochrome ubiquinol oxidase subunit I [Chlamydiota bacterium]